MKILIQLINFLDKFIDEKEKSKIVLVEGGDSRQESSRNAVLYLLNKGFNTRCS